MSLTFTFTREYLLHFIIFGSILLILIVTVVIALSWFKNHYGAKGRPLITAEDRKRLEKINEDKLKDVARKALNDIVKGGAKWER